MNSPLCRQESLWNGLFTGKPGNSLNLMSSYLLGESLNISTAKFAKNAKLSSNIFANFAHFAVRFTQAGLWTLSLSNPPFYPERKPMVAGFHRKRFSNYKGRISKPCMDWKLE